MPGIEVWIALLIVVVMLTSAIAVLLMQNHIAAVAAASVVSLGLAVVFVLLKAPDVAMTEAAVGAGLSSLILALGLRRLGLWQVEGAVPKANLLNQPAEQNRDA